MTVHFTSDLHLGHAKVATIRGFESTDDHDAVIADAWRGRVMPDDVVWVLGDLAVSNPAYALGVLADLPGRKRLVLGNHDRAHPMHRDAHRWGPVYLEAFEWVASAARMKVQGREVVLSHFPYERDRFEARHLQWRLRDEGLPLLHGHTHGKERLTVSPDKVAPDYLWNRVEVHVGLDAWDLRPVTDDEVADLLSEAWLA